MIKGIKRKIRGIGEKRCQDEYQQMWNNLVSYDGWVRRKEEEADRGGPDGHIAFFSLKDLEGNKRPWERVKEEIICFSEPGGRIRREAAARIEKCFKQNPEVMVIYGDEDEWNETRTARTNPWYKPDYSPDTLLSWFYPGALTAFRKEVLAGVSFEGCQTPRQKWYALCLQTCLPLRRHQVLHLKEILITVDHICYWGFEEEYRALQDRWRKLLPVEKAEGISIIIPSKDNPQILEQCLKSIKEYSDGMNPEVIVVDNGSGKEALKQLKRLEKEYGFHYLYHPMEFNFSRMCNMGVEKSSKDLLLFLNDDCQARHEGWLRALAEQAVQKHVGAVGVKLYYPDSQMMQHCGVYSIYLGPVHKLQYRIDDGVLYDRRNRGVRDVLAVTGACLMMRKSVFMEAEGFDEKLKVAFNDVDLCWRLHEMGYFNVLHSDIFLWHYESLSRGSDTTPEKLERLKGEQTMLHDKHKELWDKDPFYHENFASDILDYNFSPVYKHEVRIGAPLWPIPFKLLPKKLREDDCVAIFFEFSGESTEWFRFRDEPGGEEGLMYFQGSAMVLGSDNAFFEKSIVLLGEEGFNYYFTPKPQYRPDVAANVEGQVNIDLSGFACLVDVRGIQDGTYELAVWAKDKCCGQYLMRKAGLKLCFDKGKVVGRIDNG